MIATGDLVIALNSNEQKPRPKSGLKVSVNSRGSIPAGHHSSLVAARRSSAARCTAAAIEPLLLLS